MTCTVLGAEPRAINRTYKNPMSWSLHWGAVDKLEEGGHEKQQSSRRLDDDKYYREIERRTRGERDVGATVLHRMVRVILEQRSIFCQNSNLTFIPLSDF